MAIVNGKNSFAIPPERRCQGVVRSVYNLKNAIGTPCSTWACVGERFCRNHNKGRSKRKHGGTRRLHNGKYRGKPMPRFYSKFLTRTLSDAVEEALAVSPKEQLQLFEELALIRDYAGQGVQLYSQAREAAAAHPDNAKLQDLVVAAGGLMLDQLRSVINTCESAARIDAAAKDKVSVHTMHFFVDQIVRIAFESFGDDERAHEFERQIRTNIKLPSAGNEGTSLTPDMDVIAMDASVPK